MYGSYDQDSFYRKLFFSLDYILKNCFMTNNLMISVDGTTPYSKIILQKKDLTIQRI